MTYRLRMTLATAPALRLAYALVGLCALAGLAVPAQAQTTAPGPYYALPSWDQTLPANTRFIVLSNMASEAVLDRETGLVWERSPSAEVTTRDFAPGKCIGRLVGNRMGWRLPAIQELMSLIDRAALPGALKLPAGHPFLGSAFAGDAFWSATASSALSGYVAGYVSGDAAIANNTNFLFPVWCVRGGQGLEQQ